MRKCILAISFLNLVMISMLSKADPSTEVLLPASSSSANPLSSGLQSGRYQTKEPSPEDQPIYSAKRNKKKSKDKKPASENAAVAAPEVNAAEIESEVVPTSPPVPAPTLGDQVRDIFKGGAEHTGQIYREQVHPDDVRNNKVEIDFASGTIYNNSTSNLAYRNYYSFAPFMKAGAHLWLTPLVGISGSYLSSFSETIPSALSSGSTVSVKSEWTQLSIDFRKFFGMSRRANSLNYGLFYDQYKMNVSQAEVSRVGLNSAGFGIYLNARVPTAPTYAWTFGGEVLPSVSHSETQTALNLQSGTSNTASRFGFFLGGELKLSRENQLIWMLGTRVEKDQFSGASNLADPYSGTTPNGVGVVNTWTYFNLGYRWGQ